MVFNTPEVFICSPCSVQCVTVCTPLWCSLWPSLCAPVVFIVRQFVRPCRMIVLPHQTLLMLQNYCQPPPPDRIIGSGTRSNWHGPQAVQGVSQLRLTSRTFQTLRPLLTLTPRGHCLATVHSLSRLHLRCTGFRVLELTDCSAEGVRQQQQAQ